MRRVVRSRTRTPRVFSRSATARLTAAFGTPSARAAAEKPLRSTTFASMASCAGVQIRFMAASIPPDDANIVSPGRRLRQSAVHCAPQPVTASKGRTMKFSMHAMSVDVFANALGNLSWVLEKAAASAAQRKFDPAVLLAARLAPDMLPLTRQVQIASDIAKNSVARLAAQDPPRFEDTETTIEQLRARLARAIDYLRSIPASALEGAETRDIKVPTGERTLEFKGLEFLQRWAIPNVFFHVVTAYDILRHNGVELGKADFLRGGRDP